MFGRVDEMFDIWVKVILSAEKCNIVFLRHHFRLSLGYLDRVVYSELSCVSNYVPGLVKFSLIQFYCSLLYVRPIEMDKISCRINNDNESIHCSVMPYEYCQWHNRY